MIDIKIAPIAHFDYNSIMGNAAFGMRLHPIKKKWLPHEGIDIKAAEGTPILAVCYGTVLVSKRQSNGKGYGEYVVIRTDDGDYLGAHMKSRTAKVGQRVKAGDIIGYVGSTGDSTGPHLHFGVCKNFNSLTDKGWEDPLPAIKEAINMPAKATAPKEHWAKKYLDSLVKKGIIKNPEAHENTLDDKITKGEVFALIDRATDK